MTKRQITALLNLIVVLARTHISLLKVYGTAQNVITMQKYLAEFDLEFRDYNK